MNARRLYEDLAGHSTAVGAYTFVSEEEERKFQFYDRKTRIAGTYDVVGDPDNLSPDEERGRLTVRVPSPWHAVIHLLVNCHDWLDGTVLAGRSSGLIYRGQGDVEWQLVPSIYREGVNFNRQRDELYAFVNIIERFYRYEDITNIVSPSLGFLVDEPPEKVIQVAAAQHYGICTQLLDFTADPAAAVWFACQSASKIGSREAVVFALPTRFAPVFKLGALFPHPYVTRLYRQHGLFVEGRGAMTARALRQACVEVRFPPDPNFRVLRDGLEINLLEGDPFWSRCVKLARDVIDRGELDNLLGAGDDYDGDQAAMGILGDFPGYPEVAHAEEKARYLQTVTRDLLQILLSVSVCFAGSRPRVLNHAIRWLTRCPQPLIALYPLLERELSRFPEQEPTRQAGLKLLDALRAQLGNSPIYEWNVPCRKTAAKAG